MEITNKSMHINFMSFMKFYDPLAYKTIIVKEIRK